MKKYLIKLSFAALVILPFTFSGCILDALNTLTQNVPISQDFQISSSADSYTQSETIDLSNSSTYQQYADKIQQISFLQTQYRTKSVTPTDLSANISLTLKDNKGNLLFTYPLGTISPADYINTPYQLNLTSAQIQLINDYLSTLSNKVFVATLSITNITSSTKPYTLNGVIDIVFQMKANTK